MRKFFRSGVVAVVLATATLMMAGPVASHDPGAPLLPNLVPRSLYEADIVVVLVDTFAGKQLRLDNELENNNYLGHPGPLEVFPLDTRRDKNDCDGDGDTKNDRRVKQRIFRDSNNSDAFERGTDKVSSEVLIDACMVFHPEHSHWHFDAIARYELREIGGASVSVGEKISFCIADVWRRHADLAGSPALKYYKGCGGKSTQGISVGWSDEYSYNTAGQWLTIPSGTPAGDYCLSSTLDPDGLLLESNEDDNVTRATVYLNPVTNTVTKIFGGC